MLYYFIFLRVTPIVPNWFLNCSSSLVGVPFNIFFWGTAIGILPWTFLLIKTGLTINEAQELGFEKKVSYILSQYFQTLFSLLLLGSLALIPTLIKRKVAQDDTTTEL